MSGAVDRLAEMQSGGPVALAQERFTDAGNAGQLIDLHGARIRYVRTWGSWLVWQGGVWQRDDRAVLVAQLAQDVGRGYLREAAQATSDDQRRQLAAWGVTSLNAARIRAMIELARGAPAITIHHEDLDANPWLLGVANGVIDLRTGTHRASTPEDLITLRSPIAWDPTATATRWERALSEWFPEPEVQGYVHRLVGAALVGEQRDHVFAIHYGTGANGKGTFTRALQAVLGPYALVPDLSLIVHQKHSEHATARAALFRIRLAVASETDRRVRLNEALLKNLTGGDRIQARRLYENFWEFTPTHSLWLQTNHLPRITGRDHGIWRRVRVVPWTQVFQRQITEDLDNALAAEASGILRWAVEGTARWAEQGLTEPEPVVRATLNYRAAEDQVARFAGDIGLRFTPTAEVPAQHLNALLKEWCAAEDTRVSQRDLADWLEEHGARQDRPRTTSGARPRVWVGVTLDPNADPDDPTTPTGPGVDQLGPGGPGPSGSLHTRARVGDLPDNPGPPGPPPSHAELTRAMTGGVHLNECPTCTQPANLNGSPVCDDCLRTLLKNIRPPAMDRVADEDDTRKCDKPALPEHIWVALIIDQGVPVQIAEKLIQHWKQTGTLVQVERQGLNRKKAHTDLWELQQ